MAIVVDMSTTEAPTAPAFELRHRLALALEYADLRPEDMAEEIGRSATTIRNYLAGRTRPTRAVLFTWAARTGVPFEWLEQGKSSTGWLLGSPVAA